MRIAIAGLGTVGSGVLKILTERRDLITRRAGQSVDVAAVIVRDLERSRLVPVAADLLTDRFDCLSDPSIDVVVELMGGTGAARDVILTALANGKNVVTANKALLCEHGDELFKAARGVNRIIAFEAAVAGGIPIIEAVSQGLAANQILAIEGILNGTCNFILTEMFDAHTSYDDAVRLAQDRGYAEADPTMDVGGIDAAQKLTILAHLAYGTKVPLSQSLVRGIDRLTLEDLQFADLLGYRVKLLATARLTEGQLEMHTQPTLIPQQSPMADVADAYNMIEVVGDAVGRTWFSGMGAGQMPTASAVVANIIDVGVGRARKTFSNLDLWQMAEPFPLQPAASIRRRFYLRFHAIDRPNTLAEIARVLGNNGISVASCFQQPHSSIDPQTGEPIVPLVILTHEALEGQMQKADAELASLDRIRPDHVRLPLRG